MQNTDHDSLTVAENVPQQQEQSSTPVPLLSSNHAASVVAGDPCVAHPESAATSAGLIGGKITMHAADGSELDVTGFGLGFIAFRRRLSGAGRSASEPYSGGQSFFSACGAFAKELLKHKFFATILDGLQRLVGLG